MSASLIGFLGFLIGISGILGILLLSFLGLLGVVNLGGLGSCGIRLCLVGVLLGLCFLLSSFVLGCGNLGLLFLLDFL